MLNRRKNFNYKYIMTVLILGALAFSTSIHLATAHAKDAYAMELANASELFAYPSLFLCVVK
jgi:hypothetical protein